MRGLFVPYFKQKNKQLWVFIYIKYGIILKHFAWTFHQAKLWVWRSLIAQDNQSFDIYIEVSFLQICKIANSSEFYALIAILRDLF